MDAIDYGYTYADLQYALENPDEFPAFVDHVNRLNSDPLYSFRPRPDNISEKDEQESFFESPAKLNSNIATFDILLGGTGSGKTEAAAAKTAYFLRTTPAPRMDTPFWVIGETYDMVCSVCWVEKLRKYIPEAIIKDIEWYKSSRQWPFAVILKDMFGTGTNWVIEFKSYAQGRQKFQAASIGGYWFNEEVPMEIVEEVRGRTREYNSPGWADFTPLEIRTPEWPEAYERETPGWTFYHLNAACNDKLAPGWFENYIASIPEDMRDTRQYGVFASFRGQVFKEWQAKRHVIDPFEIPDDWKRFRGIDFGYNNPFCCLWVARDWDGVYYVYDEHFKPEALLKEHAEEIQKRDWDDRHPIVFARTWSDHDAQSRSELAQYGIHCTPAKKDVIPSIGLIRQMLMDQGNGKPRLFVFRNCKNLIREMRAYHWAETTGKDAREKNAVDAPVPFDDHAVDALRYVVYSEEVTCDSLAGPVGRKSKPWEQAARRFMVKG